MNTRSSHQLRPCGEVNLEKKRSRSESLPKTATTEYERERKRKQREKEKERKENVKRGRKETISISSMSLEEKRNYERKRKAARRQKSKIMSLHTSTIEQNNDKSSDVREDEENEVDFPFDDSVNIGSTQEAGAIINMIQNSPSKRRKTEKALFGSLQAYCADFTDNEVLDLFVALAQALSSSILEIIKEMGVDITELPKRTKVKRKNFSEISKSSKHRHKDNLLAALRKYNDRAAAQVFVQMLQRTVHVWVTQLHELKTCGIVIYEKAIPVKY